MKVYLGPYTTWIGPYQIAELLCFWVRPVKDECGFDSKPDWVHDFGTWLAEDKNGNPSKLAQFCEWVQSKKRRIEFVHVDNYDVWGMDHTLAIIILPMLQKLKTQKHGYGFIDDADVPKELRSTARGARRGIKNSYDWDNYAEARYSWMMDELIWTFEQLSNDDNESQFYDHSESSKEKDFNRSIQKLKVDRVGLELHQKRIENGLRLFGKYFRTLWD
ncbi:hypothetical protein UFOVP112_399 [uncultured Caudovirales phage]|uniref:Uncharacterized protein n=1 Tax=uncultured Caudovirales phage TaxID=2100421 RepID=A0A6J5L4R0_9CAUD|nr:hypothetical protein UFOVP112_399 [uncultured Caudovirales phage]